MSAEYSVDAAFDAWVATLPAKHWAKYDISACRLGWEAQKANRIEADESAVPVAWGKFVADGGPCDGQLYEHADTKEEIEALIRDHPVDDCGSFRCAPLYTHPPAQAAQVAQLWEMKQRACLAHALCNELRLAHPEIPELGDDGVLHEAIHDILRVDTPTAEPVAQGEPSARDFTEEVGTNGKPTGYFIFKDANSPDAADSGRVDEILAHLKDPANVHVMMLRGVIAVPSIRSMVDLRGEVLNGEDVQLARIAELQEQLAAQGQGDGIDMRKYVRHLADVLEAGIGLWKVDADLQRLAAAINANESAPPTSPAGVPDEVVRRALAAAGMHEDWAPLMRSGLLAVWPSVPDGCALVPREPTPEMIAACIAVWQARLRRKAENGTLLCGGDPEKSFRENWAAMIAAVPSAPAGVPDGWADVYAAFKGAFDTPAAWLKDNSEYANDARKRLREFNEAMLAAAPSASDGDGGAHA